MTNEEQIEEQEGTDESAGASLIEPSGDASIDVEAAAAVGDDPPAKVAFGSGDQAEVEFVDVDDEGAAEAADILKDLDEELLMFGEEEPSGRDILLEDDAETLGGELIDLKERMTQVIGTAQARLAAQMELVEVQAGKLEQAELRIAALEKRAETSQNEAKQLNSRLIRVTADYDNFRKRAQREKDETRKFGIERVLSDFLPVIDNLLRAVEHAGADVNDSFSEGVQMVLRQFVQQLKKYGVVGFDSLGERFDPQFHEAVQQIHTTEISNGVIMNEFQRGYHIHERLLRPALVVVAFNPNGEVAPPPEDEPADAELVEASGFEDEGDVAEEALVDEAADEAAANDEAAADGVEAEQAEQDPAAAEASALDDAQADSAGGDAGDVEGEQGSPESTGGEWPADE